MSSPWIYGLSGLLFCAAGAWLFHRHAFEEGRSVFGAVLVMIAGLVLIGIGLAKFYKLIP